MRYNKKAGVQDPEQARQYTQQGIDVLNEQSKTNPQGLQSLLASFMGGGGGGSQNKVGGGRSRRDDWRCTWRIRSWFCSVRRGFMDHRICYLEEM